MAQYYQVTSLEELHQLYPNLQIDNTEGIQCVVQDDQVTQFNEGSVCVYYLKTIIIYKTSTFNDY